MGADVAAAGFTAAGVTDGTAGVGVTTVGVAAVNVGDVTAVASENLFSEFVTMDTWAGVICLNVLAKYNSANTSFTFFEVLLRIVRLVAGELGTPGFSPKE